MATPTLAQVRSQIAKLQAQAEKVRLEEVRGIVARINEAIELYGLVPSDLTFRTHAAAVAKSGARGATTRSPTSAATPADNKYADARGNTWSGRGRRPLWLSDALAAGKELHTFLVSGAAQALPKPPTPKAVPAKSALATVDKVVKKRMAKYRDPATGSTWTGAGSQPTWLRAGLAAGKKLAHFTITGVATNAAARKTAAPATKRGAARRG